MRGRIAPCKEEREISHSTLEFWARRANSSTCRYDYRTIVKSTVRPLKQERFTTFEYNSNTFSYARFVRKPFSLPLTLPLNVVDISERKDSGKRGTTCSLLNVIEKRTKKAMERYTKAKAKGGINERLKQRGRKASMS